MDMVLEAECRSCSGSIRQTNEDNFYFDGKYNTQGEISSFVEYSCLKALADCSLFSIYDGMGGEKYGDLASLIAARETSVFQLNKNDPVQTLESLAAALNQAIVAEASLRLTRHMGSTMVSFLFTGEKVYLCNVGDSRAYRIRSGSITQLSCDHVEDFSFLPAPVKRKPALSQYLGVDPEEFVIEPFLKSEKVEPGDYYFLCSDGLTDMVPEEQILSVFSENRSLATLSDTLLASALDNGGKDNITFIVCHIKST